VDQHNLFVTATGEWNLLPDEALDFLFEDHPLPSWIYDVATLGFLRVNRAAIEQYGYSREEFLGMGLPDIRPTEDIEALRRNISSEHGVLQDSPVWRHQRRDKSFLSEREGHRVTVVSDGRAALTALEQGHFDLVLMDVQMPVMDGLQATCAIRGKEGLHGKRLPIVALTAHAMRGDEEALISAGIDAYVPKPVCAQRLFNTIAEVLSGSRQPSPRS
jgi:PAS domain S-box-containing protein